MGGYGDNGFFTAGYASPLVPGFFYIKSVEEGAVTDTMVNQFLSHVVFGVEMFSEIKSQIN